MRRIKSKGGKTFAHVLGKGTIEIKRQKQRFIVTGTDFQIIGTSPDTDDKLILQVEGGILSEDGLEFIEDNELTDEERAELDAKGAKPPTDVEADALKDKKPSEDAEE